MAVVAQDDGAHLILFEIQRKAVGVVRKFEELTSHRVLEAVDLCDAVARGNDPPHVGRDEAGVEILEPLPDDLRDLFRADTHLVLPPRMRPPGGGAAAVVSWRRSRRSDGPR